MSFIVYWSWKALFKVLHLMVLSVVTVVYFGKGKSVPPVKNPLLLKSAKTLSKEIREGKIKSEDVVLAFIARIKEVEPLINALAEERFQEAIQDAREVDSLVASGRFSREQLEVEKPLLGVPFTVKVLLCVKGLRWTAACSLFEDNIGAEDAPSVALLRKAGAIVLTSSNAASFGIGFDTVNPMYGRTCNPYDVNRTPGGSSGGEAALLASAASVIGLGNDLAGSIRLPAHFNGVFSHKASLGMVPSEGSFPKMSEETKHYMYTGPMCRYSEDLSIMMKVLSSQNNEKIDFDKPVNFRKLKIYYQKCINDPRVRPIDQDIQKAIEKAIEHFRENYGVVVQEVDIKELNLAVDIVIHILVSEVPNPIEMVTAGKIQHLNYTQELFKMMLGKSNQSFWTVMALWLRKFPLIYSESSVPYLKNVLESLHQNLETLLDEDSVLFFPCAPFSAPRSYEMFALIGAGCYSGIFNYLGLPVTQCPLGLNNKGLPHGMQIIGKMNNDPLTLACAVELSKVFGGWIPPS